MNYELRIALRYIWTARKQLHTAFLSLISTLGLAVGVATLIVSLALLSGLQGKIKSRLQASTPHLLVEPAGSHTIDDVDSILTACRSVAKRVDPVVTGIAWASNERAETGRPARIRTIPSADMPPSEPLNETRAASPQPGGTVWMMRSTASALHLGGGDDLVLVGPRTRLTPFGPTPVWRRYRDIRLLDAPVASDQEAEILLTFDDASNLFMTAKKPTAIELWLDDVSRVDDVRATLAARIPSVEIKTWKDINRPLFLALRLEKVVMFATISLIVLVAALNLICSLAMLVVEKRSRVGILRTLGATESSIRRIFLSIGLIIGLGGTVLGNVMGIGASWIADHYGLIPLPGDSFMVSHVPFSIDLPDIIGVNVIAIILSAIATWYPARIASRLDPIAAIREE